MVKGLNVDAFNVGLKDEKGLDRAKEDKQPEPQQPAAAPEKQRSDTWADRLRAGEAHRVGAIVSTECWEAWAAARVRTHLSQADLLDAAMRFAFLDGALTDDMACEYARKHGAK